MPKLSVVISFFISLASGFAVAADVHHVTFHTEKGVIEMELDGKHAPVTTENFLKYVKDKAFDSGEFFRTVTLGNQPNDPMKIEVIQGGAKDGSKEYPPIQLETTEKTGLHHLDGTVSMARSAPNSATASFFICINDQPGLDFGGQRNSDGQGFAAFGRVTKGMDVVRKIQNAPAKGQKLTPVILINKAR